MYGGTKTEMERLLADAEKISGVHYDISNLNDVYQAIHVIQKEMDISGYSTEQLQAKLKDMSLTEEELSKVANDMGISYDDAMKKMKDGTLTTKDAQILLGTTSREASETISGSLNAMKGAWSNLLTGVADENADFDTLVGNLVDSVMTFGDNILPRVKTVLEGIGKLIKELVPKLAQELPSLLQSILPSLISGVVDLIKALTDALPSLIPVLMNGIVQAFTGIVDILPDILQALIQATVLIVQSLAEQLPTIIPQLIDAILEMIPMLIDNLPLFIKAGWQLIIGLAQGLLNSIPTLLSYLPKIGSSMLNYFKQLPSMFVEIGGNIIKGLWNGIKNVKDWLFDKIKGFKDAVLNKFKSFFGIKSPSTLFRDEVGTYLAQGIGVGFTDEMKSVAEDMVHALPTDFDVTPNITTGFSSRKQYSDNNVVSDENRGGNFTAIINNNSKYTSPSDNVRKLRQEYELYRLKYGKVGA